MAEYRDDHGNIIATNDFTAADGTVYRDGQPASFANQLREALDSYPRYDFEVCDVVDEAAHLALAVLEQGEEMDWCGSHGSHFLEREPDEFSMCLWMLHENNWDTLPEPEPCRMVPSLRIPSAVLDPAKNEELMGAGLPAKQPGNVALEDVAVQGGEDAEKA